MWHLDDSLRWQISGKGVLQLREHIDSCFLRFEVTYTWGGRYIKELMCISIMQLHASKKEVLILQHGGLPCSLVPFSKGTTYSDSQYVSFLKKNN